MPAEALSHPAFDPYRDDIVALNLAQGMPGLAALNAQATTRARVNARGLPLRFCAPARVLTAREYESGILQTGCIPTRVDTWHDVMNALVWLRYPRFKAALNAAHVAAFAEETGSLRGSQRDALTVLDESGIWVTSADPALVPLLQQHRWAELFWTQRARVQTAMRFVVVGHALLEKLLAPYPAITGKCLFTAPGQPAETALAAVVTPAMLTPLPLLGIPGWDAANSSAAYYADTTIFRRARPADRPR
jgi:hypothetical protein